MTTFPSRASCTGALMDQSSNITTRKLKVQCSGPTGSHNRGSRWRERPPHPCQPIEFTRFGFCNDEKALFAFLPSSSSALPFLSEQNKCWAGRSHHERYRSKHPFPKKVEALRQVPARPEKPQRRASRQIPETQCAESGSSLARLHASSPTTVKQRSRAKLAVLSWVGCVVSRYTVTTFI